MGDGTDQVIMQLADGSYVDFSPEDIAPTIAELPLSEHSSEDSAARDVAHNDAMERLRTLRTRAIAFSNDFAAPLVPLIFAAPDLSFDWDAISRTEDESATAELVAGRRSQVEQALKPAVELLTHHGAEDVQTFWITPSVSAAVPRDSVATLLAELPPEWRVEINTGRRGRSGQAYGGEEARNGMRTAAFVNAGYDGSLGNRVNTNNRIRAGIVEWMDGSNQVVLNKNHYGFKYSSGSSRWGSIYRCPGSTCTIATVTSGNTHGTKVARILAGSIEAGQDPAIVTGLDRRRRSGMLSGSSIHYYGIGGDWCNGAIAAVQTAVSQQVDVLNWSLSMTGSEPWNSCSRFNDCGGLNAAISNATDAGVLFVSCMGNDGDQSTCNAWYPGVRRDGLTVAALTTNPASTAYDTSTISTLSCRGGMTTRKGTGATGTFAVVDVSAPGSWSYWYSTEPGGYTSSGSGSGACSYATPSVAGAAMQMRHAVKALGLNMPSARELLVNMLIMGDGFASDVGGDTAVGLDQRSGAGRVKMHFPHSSNLTAPWGWGWHTVTLVSGHAACWSVGTSAAESTSITQWKGAMTWKETSADYNAIADIRLKVVNSCPPGGGNPVDVVSDTSSDIRKRLELSQSQIGGRCLTTCVLANYIPPGQSRTISVADYFHSGSTADH